MNHLGYAVVIKEECQDEESSEKILSAIRMIRGVIEVKPIMSDISNDYFTERRVRHEMREKLWNTFYEKE